MTEEKGITTLDDEKIKIVARKLAETAGHAELVSAFISAVELNVMLLKTISAVSAELEQTGSACEEGRETLKILSGKTTLIFISIMEKVGLSKLSKNDIDQLMYEIDEEIAIAAGEN